MHRHIKGIGHCSTVSMYAAMLPQAENICQSNTRWSTTLTHRDPSHEHKHWTPGQQHELALGQRQQGHVKAAAASITVLHKWGGKLRGVLGPVSICV